MLVAVDIGNTDVVIAALTNGAPVGAVLRIPSHPEQNAAAFAAKISAWLSGIAPAALEGAVICSVVPALTGVLHEAVRRVTGLDGLIVSAALDSGLTFAIEHPETLGADILAGDAAAAAHYPLPVIVFDYGSATTVTVVDEQRCYRGGVILAGVKLGLQALANGTALLPDVHLAAPDKIIATQTEPALVGGAIYGAAAMTDGLIDRMEAELGRPCTAVLTGGLACIIAPHCRRDVKLDTHLIFRGMELLAQRNKV